eukprot:1137141-Pelagomonas_calceolata.AAC.3
MHTTNGVYQCCCKNEIVMDEVNEMKEREAQAKVDAENAAKMKAEEDKMRAANLDGIETLADDMVSSVHGGC